MYVEMYGIGIYSTSHWKVNQPKRAFLGESLEPNLRSCSWNTNSLNKKKILLLVAKTISVGLDIHQGEALNTNQKKGYG